jgi:hypothetical protein
MVLRTNVATPKMLARNKGKLREERLRGHQPRQSQPSL